MKKRLDSDQAAEIFVPPKSRIFFPLFQRRPVNSIWRCGVHFSASSSEKKLSYVSISL